MKVDRIITCWLTLALVVVGFRLFGDLSKGLRELLCSAYAVGSLLIIGIPGVVMSLRFTDYLYAHHRDLWAHLTQVGGQNLGGINGFRAIPWLWQPDSAVPEDLAPMRKRKRQLQKMALCWFVTTPIVFVGVSL
jgi:hypothetical protein